MSEQSILTTRRKKCRCVEKKRDDDDFTKGNIRQIIYRRYSKSKIHAFEVEV
jgi:hypothetical protein